MKLDITNIGSIDELIYASSSYIGDDSDAMNFSKSNNADGKQTVEDPEEGVGTPMKTQQNQPLKLAQLEVLLHEISVSSSNGTIVKPIRCPGVGRVEDYGKDSKGKPACVYNNTNCPYFSDAGFNLDTYYKEIVCKIDKEVKK